MLRLTPLSFLLAGTAQAQDREPPVLPRTALGTVVGAGVATLSFLILTEVAGADGDLSVSLGTAALGLVVGSATTGVLHGLRVVPLTAPTGERGAGLSLRVAL